METMVKHITGILAILLVASACEDKEQKEIPVPDNWITVSDDPFTATYEGGSFERSFTLPEGVNPERVYIVSDAEWLRASIEGGNTIKVKFDMSYDTEERNGYISLIYDPKHQYDIPVMQEKAPPAKVSEIVFSGSLSTIALGQAFDLKPFVEVYPENAGSKEVVFSTSDASMATITDGVLSTIKAGTVSIIITAADGGGAKLEKKINIDGNAAFDRTGWTAATSIFYADKGTNYVVDGTTGLPEHMFDGVGTTYLSIIKPGKSMNGYSTPTGHQPYFIVDMGIAQTFNYIVWGHRTNNAYDWLRVHTMRISGSNDGENFTVIQDNVKTHNVVATYTETISIPESTYRYVKCEYLTWNKSNGSSIQVAEFNLGKK